MPAFAMLRIRALVDDGKIVPKGILSIAVVETLGVTRCSRTGGASCRRSVQEGADGAGARGWLSGDGSFLPVSFLPLLFSVHETSLTDTRVSEYYEIVSRHHLPYRVVQSCGAAWHGIDGAIGVADFRPAATIIPSPRFVRTQVWRSVDPGE